MAEPDPKPEGRIKNPELLEQLHREWRECALCLATDNGLSLHHILKHPRDDVSGNLVMLCGSGTTGCHGHIENHDVAYMRLLGELINTRRLDVMDYLISRLGLEAAEEHMLTYIPVLVW